MAAASRPVEGRRLPRARRITCDADIRALMKRGKRSGTAHLDVFDSPSPFAYPRVGVVVPRYRHAVVRRNLVKRRIRELLRTEILPALAEHGQAMDVLVRARREAYDASWDDLRAELRTWLERRCWPVSSS
ncbi:MAG TPA: ribonuclease P protein component [Longimicrobiales bacterium]|nr:ribonuclease P protein component [Longimicrobiales bacterium]